MYLFDTNIFLEILLDQQNAEKALQSLELMSDRQRGWVTAFSLHAIEAIVGGKKRFTVLRDFLRCIQQHPYLERYSTTLEEEVEITRVGERMNLDFDDSLQYFVAKQKRLTLVTFDKHFLKVKDIKVLFPG